MVKGLRNGEGIEMYVNGNFASGDTQSGPFGYGGTTSLVRMGGEVGMDIDDFAIWYKQLTAADIQLLFSSYQ